MFPLSLSIAWLWISIIPASAVTVVASVSWFILVERRFSIVTSPGCGGDTPRLHSFRGSRRRTFRTLRSRRSLTNNGFPRGRPDGIPSGFLSGARPGADHWPWRRCVPPSALLSSLMARSIEVTATPTCTSLHPDRLSLSKTAAYTTLLSSLFKHTGSEYGISTHSTERNRPDYGADVQGFPLAG